MGVVGVLSSMAWAQREVRVVAASDLQFALTEIAELFQKQNPGIRVQLNFGSSGRFYAQIVQGLPADIFFSADEVFPQRLENQGFTVAGTAKLYAVGRMALWVHNSLVGQGLDPQTLGPRLLLDPRITRLAIANPVHAPYGRAAVSLLEKLAFIKPTQTVPWEEMSRGVPAYFDVRALSRGKSSFEFVYGENISQAAQIALTNTRVGLIALSLAISETMQRNGRYWLAPLSSHMRLNQNYVILRGQDRPEVRRFYDYMNTTEAQRIMRKYGFLLPGERLPND